MKKIFIVYATAGIGHKKAAIAVKKAIDEIHPEGVETVLFDALDYTPASFKRSYLQLYLLAVNKLSFVWGFMYYLTDNYYFNLLVSRVRRLGNSMNAKRLTEYLLKEKPDVVVSTHFFASEVIADLRRKKVLDTHLVTVVTDYRLHSWWVSGHTDSFIVAGEDAYNDCVKWRIPKECLRILGIPVEPVFSKPLDRIDIMKRFGLREDLFTVLVIGGGFGVGPIEEIARASEGVSRAHQLVVVCGHNKELFDRIDALRKTSKNRILPLGFIDNVYEFMGVSDVLISKSGGITVTESLVKELPMIVISPIPGQETRNSDYLVAHGAGIKLGKVGDLTATVEDMLGHPERIEALKAAIRKIRLPSSSRDLAKMVIEIART